jgi:hypothetical protein
MSFPNFEAISDDRPDLNHACGLVYGWLQDRPYRSFIDTDAVARDLGPELTTIEIVEFFRELREHKLANVAYRLKDNDGNFTRDRFTNLDQIPLLAQDRFGISFEVKRSNIVQVYEFDQCQ